MILCRLRLRVHTWLQLHDGARFAARYLFSLRDRLRHSQSDASIERDAHGLANRITESSCGRLWRRAGTNKDGVGYPDDIDIFKRSTIDMPWCGDLPEADGFDPDRELAGRKVRSVTAARNFW